MRGVYIPRVNHLGVISRPLALTDITAIDTGEVTMFTNAESRPLALTGPAKETC